MRRTIVTVIILAAWFCLCGMAMAGDKNESLCPKTKMRNSCFSCHAVGTFKIKEVPRDAHLNYPVARLKLFDGYAKYLLVGEVSFEMADDIEKLFAYLDKHDINHLNVEILSGGGGMFSAWRIISLMDSWKAKNNVIEMSNRSFAASAAFLIFMNGSKGYRHISPYAHLMWHEIITAKMFDIAQVADKEEEARLLRKFQDMANQYLFNRSSGLVTKARIDEAVRKKEWWLSGKTAFDLGFADKLIRGKD